MFQNFPFHFHWRVMSEDVQGYQNTEATAMLSIVQVVQWLSSVTSKQYQVCTLVQILPGLDFFLPWAHARRLRQSFCVSKCVCVCHCASCYIPVIYVENKVPLGFRGRYNIICIVWIALKTLCSNVLATFSDHHSPCFLSSSCSMKETVVASF